MSTLIGLWIKSSSRNLFDRFPGTGFLGKKVQGHGGLLDHSVQRSTEAFDGDQLQRIAVLHPKPLGSR